MNHTTPLGNVTRRHALLLETALELYGEHYPATANRNALDIYVLRLNIATAIARINHAEQIGVGA